MVVLVCVLQIWDVLFATSSMSAVLIHHYPLDRESRSALSLSCLALLVSPVSNAPTDALCIVLAMGGGAALFIVFWLRFWLLCRYGEANSGGSALKAKRYLEITGMEAGSGDNCGAEENLTRRHSSEGLIVQSLERNDAGDVSDSQIGSLMIDDILSGTDNCYDSSSSSDDDKFGKSHFDQFGKWQQCCSSVFLTVIGFFMVVVAFSCYIFQNRETYWIVHSIWHLLAMGSTFLFIKNKNSVVRVISKLLQGRGRRRNSSPLHEAAL
jgi:hypothetical protein